MKDLPEIILRHVRPDDMRVTVQWASSAFDYMPFTPLPARYHGKVVAGHCR